MADEVEAYVVALVRATRGHPDIELGASPRATVALYRAAQAAAVLEGREFVTPGRRQGASRPAVLGHRLVVNLDRTPPRRDRRHRARAILASVAAPPVTAGSTGTHGTR